MVRVTLGASFRDDANGLRTSVRGFLDRSSLWWSDHTWLHSVFVTPRASAGKRGALEQCSPGLSSGVFFFVSGRP